MRAVLNAKALWSPVALGVVGAVTDAEGRVLLVRQSYMPGWRLPGGGVDRGEAPEAALVREMKEEVGLEGGQARLFGIYSRKAGWATNLNLLYRIEGARVRFAPNWEVRAVIFADPENPPAGTTPATARRLAELFRGAAPAPFW